MSEYKFEDLKIKINNESHCKEVHCVLFKLGYSWDIRQNHFMNLNSYALYTGKNGYITYTCSGDGKEYFETHQNAETTLQGLKDRIVLKRNDVNDATHVVDKNQVDNFPANRVYYVGNKIWYYYNGEWEVSTHFTTCSVGKELIPIIQAGQPKITWRDAFRLLADGKEVEMLFEGEWLNVEDEFLVSTLMDEDAVFRIAPEYRELMGKYTKDQLIEIAGEMK